MGEATEKKVKGKTEEFYLDNYPGTGLVEGSLTHVSADEIEDMLGEEIAGVEVDADRMAELQRIVPKGEKRVMLRECAESGGTFFVATSDIHQCRYAPAVRAEKAKAKSAERRKARRVAEKAELKALRSENETLKAQTA